jgi:hypothetical protein
MSRKSQKGPVLPAVSVTFAPLLRSTARRAPSVDGVLLQRWRRDLNPLTWPVSPAVFPESGTYQRVSVLLSPARSASDGSRAARAARRAERRRRLSESCTRWQAMLWRADKSGHMRGGTPERPACGAGAAHRAPGSALRQAAPRAADPTRRGRPGTSAARPSTSARPRCRSLPRRSYAASRGPHPGSAEDAPDGRSRAADLRSDQHEHLIETARQPR